MPASKKPEQICAWILAATAVTEGTWGAVNAVRDWNALVVFLGFNRPGTGTPTGWILALIFTVLYVARSARLPSVRANLFRPTGLKALALIAAVSAGILEEVVFRRWTMDYLRGQGAGLILQVLASGLLFGLAHGIWGLMGRSFRAAFGAAVATGALGAGLAVVYLASGRSLAPCIAAHFLIDALIEPGLVLAAVRGEMAGRRPFAGSSAALTPILKPRGHS